MQKAKGEPYTPIEILQITKKEYPTRFNNKSRDRVHSIYMREVKKLKKDGQTQQLWEFMTRSFPTYTKDKKAHTYYCFFQFELNDEGKPSLSKPFKWREGMLDQPQKGKELHKQGINGDFFYRVSAIAKYHGNLYGLGGADRLPTKANPKMLPFFGKHSLAVLDLLLKMELVEEL